MSLKTVPCKHGTFTVYDNDYWIGRALIKTGECDEVEVQKLLSLVDFDSKVIEVGANIGVLSVPLAKKVAELHLFEPQPAIFALLKQNISRNDCCAVLNQQAVGRASKPLALYPLNVDEPDINMGAASVKYADSEDIDLAIEPVTLDNYCVGWDRLDLIKIDVEGWESEVLDGAADTIKKFKPLLWVENDRAEKSEALIKQIRAFGYRLWWCPTPIYNPDPNAVGLTFSFNMLCAPMDRLVDPGDDCMPIISAKHDWHLAAQWAAKRYAVVPKNVVSKNSGWACVARLGAIGDNLIASSVFPHLRKKFGKLEVICSEPWDVVFENNPYIDKLTVKKQGKPGGDGMAWQNYWLDRADDYEFFINLSHTCEGLRALAATMTAFYWPAEARRKLFGQSYLETVADICGVPYDELKPDFFPTDAELENANEIKKNVGGRYVAWILSGSRWDKLWPHTMTAVARVIKEFNLPVVLTGTPGKDHELASVVVEHVRRANGTVDGIHLAMSPEADKPSWPIRRVLTQVQQADVVVSPDTGPAWAVAMHDTPKIMLLSHAGIDSITKHWHNTETLHARSHVACWPCHLLHDSKESCQRVSGSKDDVGAACISDIGVEEVLAAIKRNTQPQPLQLAAE